MFNTGTWLGYYDWNSRNVASANLGLSPAAITGAQLWYNEYPDDGGFQHFYVNVNFFGNFGEGEEGMARGRAFFGPSTPEPSSLAQVGIAAFVLLLRKPFGFKLRELLPVS